MTGQTPPARSVSQSWSVLDGDCIPTMHAMMVDSIDAIVCDPPYGLEFMGKAWDRFKPQDFQAWCETWGREALRVLKPGGYLLAFGGTRTYHRLVSGLEDAGFESRDEILSAFERTEAGRQFIASLNPAQAKALDAMGGGPLAWVYGTGFPKGKACLKPAHEPIVLARRPAARIRPLNIEGCRLDTVSAGPGFTEAPPSHRTRGWRWPANVVLDPEAATMMDDQSGDRPGFTSQNDNGTARGLSGAVYGDASGVLNGRREGFNDSGGASRFFYCAKPDKAERNLGGPNPHPTVKPVELMRWLCRLVTPEGGTVLDPFTGSGTTGIAAMREGFSFIGIEQNPDYAAVARARIVGDAPLINGALEEAA